MKFLRTASTRRLLAVIAGATAVIAAGTTIAIAAAGSGPVPVPKPLSEAVHDALAAPPVDGISARISFTNNLIDSSDIQGTDPLLSGATGRLWFSPDHGLRLELQGANGDAQLVVAGSSFWVYDPTSNTAYEGRLPRGLTGSVTGKGSATHDRLPTIAQIQSFLQRLMQHAGVSGAIPSDVAGQPAYTVRVAAKHDGGLLGSAELAWDAVHGVPLRIAVYARGDSSPVFQLTATSITYGRVSASVFAISPPSGAKVVPFSVPGGAISGTHDGHRHRTHAEVAGVAAVAGHLPFKLVAPSALVGLPRRTVTLLDWEGSPGALVTYGQNLGGIAVIEQAGRSGSSAPAGSGGYHQGLSLPTVSINGATGQELDTALGTIVRFTQDGVTYTVIGSVPPAAADAAARVL